MTELLVSVRNVAEAMLAVTCPLGVLDVKEPSRGSLGAADLGVIAEIAEVIPPNLPLSVALGELSEATCDVAAQLPARVDFAKIGLAGHAGDRKWPLKWQSVIESLPPRTKSAAVVYADTAAESPALEEIVEQAQRLGCGALLVDTFHKSAGNLLQHWQTTDLAEFVAVARSAGMHAVVAGSLGLESLPFVLPTAPDFFAVRGAVCSGGRTGALDAMRLRDLARELHLLIAISAGNHDPASADSI